MRSAVPERDALIAPRHEARRHRLVASIAVAALVAGILGASPSSVDAATLLLKPGSGPAGTVIVVSGGGWSKAGAAEISWDGKFVADGVVDLKGNLSATFKAPDDAPGKHTVRACAPSAASCDDVATYPFDLAGPGPTATPKATLKPTPVPTKPGPTSSVNPGGSPEPTGSAGPGPSLTPGLPVPSVGPGSFPGYWEPPPDGWPDILPRPLTPVSCEAAVAGRFVSNFTFEYSPLGPVGSLSYGGPFSASGLVARPLVPTSSGSQALASAYDDFGSAGRSIDFRFERPRRFVALMVGRESPPIGGEPIIAALIGYSVGANGLLVEAARDEVVLPAVPTPIRQCLHIAVPSGPAIRVAVVEYLDADGASAYERRWVDDVRVDDGGAIDPTVPTSSIAITAPTDGAVLALPPGSAVTVQVSVVSASPPRVIRLDVNERHYDVPVLPAADGNPSHFRGSQYVEDLPVDTAIVVTATLDPSRVARSTFTIRPPVSGNLLITGVEPIQVTQTPSWGVPLIADRPTAVRIYLQGISDSRGPWRLSQATLTTRASDGRSWTHQPANVGLTDGFTAPTEGSDRNVLSDSLLFLLSPDEARGSLDLTVEITGQSGRPETSTTDNRWTGRIVFRPGTDLTTYVFLGTYLGRPGGSWTEVESFARGVEALFPVRTFRAVPVPGVGLDPVPFRDLGDMQGWADRWLARLPDAARIYAVRPDTSCLAPPPATCEAGWSWFRRTDGWRAPGSASRIMAQELSHSYGLAWHAQTDGEWADGPYAFWNPEWPYYHTTVGQPGLDLVTDPARPGLLGVLTGSGHVHDYMSYAALPQWTSPFTYCALGGNLNGNPFCAEGTRTEGMRFRRIGLGQPVFGPPAPGGAMAEAPTGGASVTTVSWVGPARGGGPLEAAPASPGWRLAVTGTIAADGRVAIGPAEVVDRPDDDGRDLLGREYVVELLDPTGAVLAHRGFIPATTHPLDAGSGLAWTLLLPAVDGVALIRVRHLGQVVAERAASPHAPTIDLVAPAAGASWADGTPAKVAWRAADADGDGLVVSVTYSADGGATWFPLAVAVGGDSISVDPATLPGSATARLRVTVSDGVRTAVADLAGTISVSDHAPTIRIDAPADGTTVRPGRPFMVTALAFDWETPAEADRPITWAADGGAALGAGSWLLLDSLAVGRHTITARIDDRAGQTAEASITVIVAGEPWSPVAATGGGEPEPTSSLPLILVAGLALAALVSAIGFLLLRRRVPRS